MAPELALGEEVDGRADIYALGCVAYFLLTGRMVFEADNTMRLMVKHVEEKPVAPSSAPISPIPRSLDDAMLGCLAKDPAARTPSAAALVAALRRRRPTSSRGARSRRGVVERAPGGLGEGSHGRGVPGAHGLTPTHSASRLTDDAGERSDLVASSTTLRSSAWSRDR